MSFIAHDKQGGHFYPGVNTDLFTIKCLWVKTFNTDEDESAAAWVGLSLLGTLVYGVDVPFSFILDTFLLPVDYGIEDRPELRLTLLTECEQSAESEI